MKKICIAVVAFILFSSHDMYLKLDTFFLEPNTAASIMLLNGTFEASENTIDRNRMLDVSLIGNGKRTQVDTTQWREEGEMTVLDFTTGAAGTWVAGVSTRARNIEMAAADFNEYLEHDGVLDELDWRRANDMLDTDAVEKYAKHVKTIFQVGDVTTDDWKTPLDYPIEFMPLSNPYDLHVGEELEVMLFFRGEALRDQIVIIGSQGKPHTHDHDHDHDASSAHTHEHGTSASDSQQHSHEADHAHSHAHAESAAHAHDHDHEAGTAHSHEHDASAGDGHEHSHEDGHTHSHEADHAEGAAHEHSHAHDDDHQHAPAEVQVETDHHHHGDTQVRTDLDGKFKVKLSQEGIWYLRTIFMTQAFEDGLTHESNWATLTFEVGHGHSHGPDGHSHADGHDHHDHAHPEGIPGYLYWIGSFLVVLGLFFWFNRKQ